MGVVWAVVALVLVGVLAAAWWADAGVRRRGSRVSHHSDVWYEVREARRDVEALQPLSSDHSWTSWSRRNHR